MPCNAIATQTAHVDLDTALILDNPQAIVAVQQLLAQQLNVQPDAIIVYSDTHTWQAGWDQWRTQRTVQQATPVDQLAGARYIDWVCDQCAVRLHRDGNVELRDGWDLSRRHITNPNRFLIQVEALLKRVTGLLFQQQARAAIANCYDIAAEQRAPNGALILTVSL